MSINSNGDHRVWLVIDFRGTHSHDRIGYILQDIHLEYNLDSNKVRNNNNLVVI